MNFGTTIALAVVIGAVVAGQTFYLFTVENLTQFGALKRSALEPAPGRDDDSCACGACRDTSRLSLKLIAHHGRFVRQLVGGGPRVTGPDVILAHRPLKNSVGGDAYLLFTEPALERVGMDPVAHGMRRHLVSYPRLGDVPCFVADLDPVGPPALADAAIQAA